jgi:hypothetical protein
MRLRGASWAWIPAVLPLLAVAAGTLAQEAGFDHTSTRFVLTGAHENTRCEGCHRQGVFRGTPTECSFCHGASGTLAESVKPPDHPRTPDRCQDCHVTTTWLNVRFDHSVVSGRCSSCHNGVEAAGKPPRHVTTTAECDFCHIDIDWRVIRFDHSGVTGACSSCHNGVEATGKPNGHVSTTAECDLCHVVGDWRVVRFDHSGITQPCSSCHDGMRATGKPSDHISTNAECDLCHIVSDWSAIQFDHSGVTGSCSSCHNGIDATGVPNGHFVSMRECDECHLATAWAPDTFRHVSPNYPGDHRRDLACTDCHQANSEAVQWPFPALQPDCGACHQSDFEPGPHKKHENPDAFYTASELRDCTGACHVYTDASLTVIKEARSGEHRVSDGGF